MEAYLKDKIIQEIKLKPKLIELFLKEYNFNKKIDVEDLFLGPYNFTEKILEEITFHNIKKVRVIYKIIFNFDILECIDFKRLEYYINVRHGIVHGNSILNGNKILINPTEFILICDAISRFIEGIDYFVKHKKKRKKFSNLLFRDCQKFKAFTDSYDYLQAVFRSRIG
jgi:hypothetical protein